MKIKLLREVLVQPSDVTATRGGTVVEMDDSTAKEYIAAGLAEEHGKSEKAIAAAPKNKMAPAASNKAEDAEENRDNFEREPVRKGKK